MRRKNQANRISRKICQMRMSGCIISWSSLYLICFSFRLYSGNCFIIWSARIFVYCLTRLMCSPLSMFLYSTIVPGMSIMFSLLCLSWFAWDCRISSCSRMVFVWKVSRTWKPSSWGIIKSRRTRIISSCIRSSISRASRPFVAVTISYLFF